MASVTQQKYPNVLVSPSAPVNATSDYYKKLAIFQQFIVRDVPEYLVLGNADMWVCSSKEITSVLPVKSRPSLKKLIKNFQLMKGQFVAKFQGWVIRLFYHDASPFSPNMPRRFAYNGRRITKHMPGKTSFSLMKQHYRCFEIPAWHGRKVGHL